MLQLQTQLQSAYGYDFFRLPLENVACVKYALRFAALQAGAALHSGWDSVGGQVVSPEYRRRKGVAVLTLILVN